MRQRIEDLAALSAAHLAAGRAQHLGGQSEDGLAF
jgi:hypothetical protein